MSDESNQEVLRAVLAVAAADGKFTHSEKGIFETLAERVGVSAMGVWRMKTELRSEDARKNLLKKQVPNPEAALKLLVATARIDGEISPEERTLLDTCAKNLGISDQDFARIYAEGIRTADALRRKQLRK